MIQSAALLKDLKVQLKLVQADLRSRADDQADRWGARLQEEYAEARRRERTGHSWVVWRDNEVDQAAVAWLIAMTFVRFCEDNDLLSGARINGQPVAVGWIAGPGDRTARAEENLTAYFRENPTHNRRDWLRQAFRVLAAQPAGKALVDEQHNPVWTADISAERAAAVIEFWRQTDANGDLVHDFTDPDLDTRFLGDLYQDLSDHARKTYALLQTPAFVEEFILDQTLTPGLAEFGLEGFKLIDPTCGSGHFLLGAFQRLVDRWLIEAPALDVKERVRRAMDSIHGVDLNPFAVAIARFRLTVAGLLVMGERSLVGVPNLGFHLAIGDSLLGEHGVQTELNLSGVDDEGPYLYDKEDLSEYQGILRSGSYHVVIGNPPYITAKDDALIRLYKAICKTAYREFQLTVPFMELFFRLAVRGGPGIGAGYVGQITGNGFMTQEFGRKVIEELLGGTDFGNPVDLCTIVDTSGAFIPGHGTPTVILVGRRRRPVRELVTVATRVKGEPSPPADPAQGRVWRDLISSSLAPGYAGSYIAVVEMPREHLSEFPWTLSDPARADVMAKIDAGSSSRLTDRVATFGYTGQTNADGAFLAEATSLARQRVEADLVREFVTGADVRDYVIEPKNAAIFPYRRTGLVNIDEEPGLRKWMWPLRSATWARATFSKNTYREDGRTWWEWHQVSLKRVGGYCLTYPSLATTQHFALDRVGRIFNKHAAFIRLPNSASEDDYAGLLGLLNSSTACFWLKQVCRNRGNGGIGGGIGDEDWEPRYEFTGSKLAEFPVPNELPTRMGSELDALAQELVSVSPRTIVANAGTSDSGLGAELVRAHHEWMRVRARMILVQEEMDWETYRLFDLVDADLVGVEVPDGISLGERAFEIALARRVEAGEEETAWFTRHGSNPVTGVPERWPTEYRLLVEERLRTIDSDAQIRLLERPEFKRRWMVVPWEDQVSEALRIAILDRLEAVDLWRDDQGPVARSIADLAHALRIDSTIRELAVLLSGSQEPDLATVLGSVALDEAVPYLAAWRYTPAGVEKYRTWQDIWELQRREDAGEAADPGVPPRYGDKDFRSKQYWQLRGGLDVRSERFILYPGLGREGDGTAVLGWAGWDHKDQALALAREFPVQDALGASDDLVTQMVAGLVELEPWLHQWHSEMDASFGVSPAQAISGVIDQQLGRLEATREEVTAWEPPAPTRGRRAKNS